MNRSRAVARVLVLVLILAMTLTLAAGCKPKTADLRTELNVRLQYSEAKQFDPSVIARASEYFVTKNLYDGLVRFKPGSFEIEPDLATSWDVSADGKEYLFHLREGVQFHKGYGELTADDVVFTFERLKNPKCELSYLFGSVIDKTEAVDKYTFKLTLLQPYAPLLTLLSYRNAVVVSKKAVEEKGDKEFGKSPVGTGPFEFQEMTEDKKVIVTAFADYWDGAQEVTKITFLPIVDEGVAALALEKGELDLMWTRGDATIAQLLENNPEIMVERGPTVTTRFVGLNPEYGPLANEKVRWALTRAVDRQAVNDATGGFETPAKSIFNPLFFGYTETGIPDFSFNLDEAKRLLAEAGYADGFDLTLLCSSRSPDPIVAQVIQENWKALGINVTLNSMEQGAYSEAKDTGDYQAVLMGVGRPTDPDLLLMEAFHSSAIGQGRANNGFYTKADAEIEAAAREMDPAKRVELYKALATKILNDMPQVPITNTLYAACWRLPVVDYVPGNNNEFTGYTLKLGTELPK